MGRSCAWLRSWYRVLHELKYCQGAVGLGSRETNEQSPPTVWNSSKEPHGGMLASSVAVSRGESAVLYPWVHRAEVCLHMSWPWVCSDRRQSTLPKTKHTAPKLRLADARGFDEHQILGETRILLPIWSIGGHTLRTKSYPRQEIQGSHPWTY